MMISMRAPAITISDHRAVYNAKCASPQRGGAVSQMRTPADREEDTSFFADVLYGRPLTIVHYAIKQ